MTPDRHALLLFAGVVAVLALASLIGFLLDRRFAAAGPHAVLDNLNARIKTWWILVGLLAAAFAVGKAGVILLFAFGSFTALRELMTLTPTRRGDHYALAAVFFAILPAQYVLIWIEWYGLYSIFIPVYAFFFRSWPRCEATPSASWSGLPRCSGG